MTKLDTETNLIATDTQLQEIVGQSQIWASEEILFPTLVSLLGYEVAESPCSYEFVRHRVAYTTRDLERAFTRPSVYWLHPVNRRYGDPLRAHVRRRFNQYETMLREGGPMLAAPDAAPVPEQPLFLTVPILQRMRAIDGWLEDDEADLLIAAVAEVNDATLLHYDRHFDAIGRVTGQPMEWLGRRGSLG